MKKTVLLSIVITSVFLLGHASFRYEREVLTAEMPVADVLEKLGAEAAPHQPRTDVRGVSVDRGREIVLNGFTKGPDGSKSDRVSKHFVCTSCHNVERDEPDLSKSDPEARLAYVFEKGLPFLQGSALYGAVDRRTFYNGDYDKKYGDLVRAARNDLREAIQLCATECAQGRYLDDWELESVLAYLWTIGLKMQDLQLPEHDLQRIDRALANQSRSEELVELIRKSYLEGMPATFSDPPQDREEGYTSYRDPERGKLIYELSCLHCHRNERYSFFNLDNARLTFEFLHKHIPVYTRYSIYQVVRYGTSPVPWKRAYMPHYTQEKMSDQMLEDLRGYIEERAQRTGG